MKPTKRARVARQRTRQLDDAFSEVRIPQRPRNGWIDSLREGLGMTKTQLAKRMGITRPSLSRLIGNETKGSITISSLENAADALGCEVRYVLFPRHPLSEMIHKQALRLAQQKLSRVNQSQALEASAMKSDSFSEATADLAKELEVRRPTDLWND